MPLTPSIYVLAGVNGSGKSSVGGSMLKVHNLGWFNPDTAARKIRETYPYMSHAAANSTAWAYGKNQLQRAIRRRESYSLETTLGGNTIANLLIDAADNGYQLKIWYVGLASVELCLQRVEQRVSRGGHDIPEAAIRHRWNASRRNLIRMLPKLHILELIDNSHQADPVKGLMPKPKIILRFREGRIMNPDQLSYSPEWAQPIVAAAVKLARSDLDSSRKAD